MKKNISVFLLFIFFQTPMVSFAAYVRTTFECVGIKSKVNVILNTSGDGQLVSKSHDPLLNTLGRSLGIVYRGYYTQMLTTFSSHRRSNGTYLEFVFPSSAYQKSLNDIPVVLRAVKRNESQSEDHLSCRTYIKEIIL